MKDRIRKIGILCFWPFPEGMAPTTRILAYANGLKENNIEVEIVSFMRIFKDEVRQNNIKHKGFINGIEYIYPHFFHSKGKNNKLIRVIDELALRFKIGVRFLQSHRKKRFDCVFFSFDNPANLITYSKLFKLLGISIGFVADEYPIPIRDWGMNNFPKEYIPEYKKAHNLISFRILMTNSLKSFYNDLISVKPTHILSNITDLNRFEGLNKQSQHRNYICYMGNMGLAKDNVDNIINAFTLIAEKFQNIDLHLYGSPNDVDKKVLEKLIINNKIEDRVFFKGRIGYNLVPQTLINAHILVTSQPKSKRAEGGFPTKLGEYLLSGVPSILTYAGEISSYITDDVNAYLVEPENPELYAKKLEYVIMNYEKALKVAENGKEYVLTNFGPKKVTNDLITFLAEQLVL